MPTDGLLKKTALLLAIMIGLTVGIGALLPDHFEVKRALVIMAPPAKIWPYINELSKWPEWDPWSRTDPQIKHRYEGTPGMGHTMHWVGPNSGQGKLETIANTSLSHARFKLSVAQQEEPRFLDFQCEDLGGKTRVTWTMSGANSMRPIGNYFGLGMDRYIGPMYEQGLTNLKSLVETGKLNMPASDTRPSKRSAD